MHAPAYQPRPTRCDHDMYACTGRYPACPTRHAHHPGHAEQLQPERRRRHHAQLPNQADRPRARPEHRDQLCSGRRRADKHARRANRRADANPSACDSDRASGLGDTCHWRRDPGCRPALPGVGPRPLRDSRPRRQSLPHVAPACGCRVRLSVRPRARRRPAHLEGGRIDARLWLRRCAARYGRAACRLQGLCDQPGRHRGRWARRKRRLPGGVPHGHRRREALHRASSLA